MAISVESFNCASGICCPPKAAFAETVKILCVCGMKDEDAPAFAKALHEHGVRFVSADLAEAIAAFADHPGRHTAE